MIRVLVTGADSAKRDESLGIPISVSTIQEAKELAYKWRDLWIKEGFHQTPAFIFVKGSEWRRVVVINSFGSEWYPKEGDK